MTAAEFVDSVTRGHFFGWLETRPCDDVEGLLLPWLGLLRTEPIQDWFFGCRAGALASRAKTPLTPVLQLLLRRHLLSISNRTNPTPLRQFWERAVGQADPTLRTLWDSAALTESKDDTIAAQEARFTRGLERAARELARAGGPAWAEETVRTLLAERPAADGGTITHVSARVVFGWEPPDRTLFRDGVLVDFRLLAAGAGPTPVTAPEVFDGRFLESLERVRPRIDAETVRQMEHRWAFLPPGFLAQTSGTAAVLLAQWLASRSQFAGGRYHALPPWVVVSGTFDFDGPAPGGTLGPAGLLAEKGRVLLEEGVRCLVVSAACDASRLLSSESLHVLRTTGGVREIAAELRGRQLVLPADIEPLDHHLLRRPPRAELNQPAVRDRARFRHTNLAESYVPPVYAFAALEAGRQRLPGRGVIHLVAEGMMGKSVLVKALKDGWTGAPRELGTTLGYAVLYGRPEDPWLFLSEIVQQARNLDPDGTLGLRHLPDDARECKTLPDVHRSLVEVLSAVRDQFCRSARPVLLAVDGLDELTARDDRDFACRIDDLLPPAAALPDGCYLLVTSRPTVRAQVRAAIDGWRGTADLYRPVELTLDDPGYRAVLEGFLLKRCGEAVRRHVGQILRLADDRFLYVHFLAALLDERTLRDTPPGRLELPAGDAIFPAYLGQLAAGVEGGPDAFERWHRPLLLLIAAAYEPVTRGHLRCWLRDRAWDRPENNQLDLALNELGVLLQEERPADEHDSRYRVAHRQILEWLRTATHPDWAGALLREGHRRIAEHGVAVTNELAAGLGSQKEDDAEGVAVLQLGQVAADALVWVPSHLMELGEIERAKAILENPDLTYCSQLLPEVWKASWQKRRVLDYCSIRIGQHLRLATNAEHQPTTELAVLYSSRSMAYMASGRIPEATRDVAHAMGLVESSRDPVHGRLYGTLHAARAELFLAQNQPEQARADFDRAIALLRPFVTRNGGAPPRTTREVVDYSALADAYSHRGQDRMQREQVGEAIQDFTEEIKLHQVITRTRFSRVEEVERFAAALRHRANAHSRRGDTAKAQADFRDAVVAYRLVLGEEGKWGDVARRSPGVVFDYGATLVEFGSVEVVRRTRFSEGLALYRTGIEQIERLLKVHDLGRLAREYPGHLYGAADAYLALPQLRQAVGKAATESLLEPSIESCQKALALVRSASAPTPAAVTGGDTARADYLVFQCHAKLSELYSESCRRDEALAEAMNAVPPLRSVLASPADLRDILANQHAPLFQCVPVWINLANALSGSGHAGRARQLLDGVLTSFAPVLDFLASDPRHAAPLEALQGFLAGAYNSRGSCYRNENQPGAALADFDRAERTGISRLTALYAGPPRSPASEPDEFVCTMAAVYSNRCATHRELHQLREAARDAERLVPVLGFLCRMAGTPRAALDRFQDVLIPSAHCLLNLGVAQAHVNEPAAAKHSFEAVSALFRPLVEGYGTNDAVVGRHTELLEVVGLALMNAGWASTFQGNIPEAVIAWVQGFQWLNPYLERWRALGVEAKRHDRLLAGQRRVHQWLRQCDISVTPVGWSVSSDTPPGAARPVLSSDTLPTDADPPA